jgi:hypothetical protein
MMLAWGVHMSQTVHMSTTCHYRVGGLIFVDFCGDHSGECLSQK